MSSSMIPLCVPEIRGNEWQYIKECLDTNWVSSVGAFVNRFEDKVAEIVGAAHGVATCNGTAALHIALLVAGVGPEDEVILPSLTFIAPANAVRYIGAWPVFMDAEPDYWQLDVQKLDDFLKTHCRQSRDGIINKKSGRRIKALLPVHILGHPVDMDPLMEIAKAHDLLVIEDATESLGSLYKGNPTGTLGDIGCFSFNGNKIMTTGGGGMIVTKRREWAERARYLTTQAKDNPIEYIHRQIGFNYRLTNIQAAMGCAQIENLDAFIAAKKRIRDDYDAALGTIDGITCMRQADWADSNCWLYTIRVHEADFGMSSRGLLEALSALSIQSRPFWQPLHLSPAHAKSQAFCCETAEKLYLEGLSLPCSVGLDRADQDRVIQAIIDSLPH